MENLNKENFFNEMQLKYPRAMNHFYIWLEKYKQKVGWFRLFRPLTSGGAKGFSYVNLEHLPHEMQIGIFMRYASDTFEEDNIEVPELKEMFETCLIASTTLLGLYKNGKG